MPCAIEQADDKVLYMSIGLQELSLRRRNGYFPLPLRRIVCGAFFALSIIVSVPKSGPTPLGANNTNTTHLPPAGRI
jgi:hypothetical protein